MKDASYLNFVFVFLHGKRLQWVNFKDCPFCEKLGVHFVASKCNGNFSLL